MIQDNGGLALQDLMANKWVFVTFFLIGIKAWLDNDVVDKLLNSLIIKTTKNQTYNLAIVSDGLVNPVLISSSFNTSCKLRCSLLKRESKFFE